MVRQPAYEPWHGSEPDVAQDGKRLVVLLPAETIDARESKSHVTLVVNLFDEVSDACKVRADELLSGMSVSCGRSAALS
jgi:hypothetical protein